MVSTTRAILQEKTNELLGQPNNKLELVKYFLSNHAVNEWQCKMLCTYPSKEFSMEYTVWSGKSLSKSLDKFHKKNELKFKQTHKKRMIKSLANK